MRALRRPWTLLARALHFPHADGQNEERAVIPETAATPASQARSDRLWIWAALGLQLVGYVIDVAWHGLVSPVIEPATRADMIRHLITVHAPLYI